MAITKRPIEKTLPPKNVDSFIQAAPDATKVVEARKGVMRGNREQISHTLPPNLLAQVDEKAEESGLTRAGLINLAISEYLKK